ncbi:glycosyltransferase [Erwinia sp. CPCC 100877]|nr:glycosyltransferase [Erwinia sp. CPCC 100877]
MISVCIATFNGEKYLEEQLDSILPQISADDELIISDDGSTDATVSIITDYTAKDARVKFFKGPGRGVIANFEYAITQAVGDFIFLADQDDVWLPEKIRVTLDFFTEHPEIDVVVSDLKIVNESLEVIESSYFRYRNVKTGFIHNILKNKYIGAGMAFRGDFKASILPFPTEIPMHDMWIGLLGASRKRSALIPQQLTLYRRHADNVSAIKTKASVVQQLKWRYFLITALIKHLLGSK